MSKELLEIKKEGFFINDKKFYLASGDIHYFRLHPEAWKRHFALAADFGLTAVQTYVPWNLHEPEKGKYDFAGRLDICAFLDEAQDFGLKILLRPSPYLCSECDFGGLPVWLYRNGDIDIRCSDPSYLSDVSDYYDILIPKILPYLSTNGGPVIMAAVENEYAGSGYDMNYMRFLADKMRSLGVDVPLFTTDNSFPALRMGSLDGMLAGANFRSSPQNPDKFADMLEKIRPQHPFFVGEFWCGREVSWGEPYGRRDPAETAEAYEKALARGYVDFYMFSGGTNFGFFSGAVTARSFMARPETPVRYIAHVTSYDEDALVTENGLPTEKYYLCREKLDAAAGKKIRYERILPFEYHAQSLVICLDRAAGLFENLDVLTSKCVSSAGLKTMEQLGQAYGFLLYTNQISTYPDSQSNRLMLNGVHDRATVYSDEKYIGTVMRDRDDGIINIEMGDKDIKLDILVENTGRINGGKDLDKDRKGITGYVLLNNAKLYNWTASCLPMKDISGLQYTDLDPYTEFTKYPAFFKGSFDAEAGCDTFIDMRGWTRGFVVVNGFNIGRFWDIGPQLSLYIPGGLLHEKDNTIEIFDVEHSGTASQINCMTEAVYIENQI